MTVAITRTEHTATALRRHAVGSADASVARRLLALALVLDGHKRADAARAAGMDRQTLCDWVHRYNADGLVGLGSRPAALRDQRRQSAYLFGAVCADRGVGAALVLPYANAEAMSLHLAEIGRQVTAGAHAVVVLDGAGWHQTGKRLRVPGNISLLRLPPYSPELNPQENVWQYLRQNQLSNRVFANYDAIVAACCTAWNALIAMPNRIRSIATRAWTKTVIA